jgi:hypothetical protein
MKSFFALHLGRTAQKHTSGFAPLVGVPAMKSPARYQLRCAGTPYPVQRTGSEFNQLAPHMPGGLDAPRLGAHRQRQGCRSPPMLKGMAQHASQRPAPPEMNRKCIFSFDVQCK